MSRMLPPWPCFRAAHDDETALGLAGIMGTEEDIGGVRHAADQRRWLIGIGVTVVFGLFGVVMTLLSYSARGKPRAAPAEATAAPVVAPAPPAGGERGPRSKGKKQGRD